MGAVHDPFVPTSTANLRADFEVLSARPVSRPLGVQPSGASVALARLQGFDIDDRPLVNLRELPGERIAALTTAALRRDMVGCEVAVMFIDGDLRKPLIVGVLQPPLAGAASAPQTAFIQADDDQRLLVSAEREIVLRCGESSITLTRAGKVIIQGNYVVSRSAGYNKIKGAAVDIN